MDQHVLSNTFRCLSRLEYDNDVLIGRHACIGKRWILHLPSFDHIINTLVIRHGKRVQEIIQ